MVLVGVDVLRAALVGLVGFGWLLCGCCCVGLFGWGVVPCRMLPVVGG